MVEMEPMKFGIITVSDSCYKGENVDRSGPKLYSLLNDAYTNCQILCRFVIADDVTMIKNILLELCEKNYDAIFTTGGTGFAPSDVTPEATRSVITKETPGISHAIWNKGLSINLLSMLSRGVSGIRDKTLIINFSGSVKAVMEQFSAIKSVIPHAVSLIRDNKEQVMVVHETLQKEMETIGENNTLNSEGKPQKKSPSKVKINVVNRDRKSPYKMITVEDAHEIIKAVCVQDSDTDLVKIQDALGRVLAEDTRSFDSLPPFPSSIKDGYAVKSSDGKGIRKVVDGVAAGDIPRSEELQKGECIRISTGAPVPPGADAVVQIEDTEQVKVSDDKTTELEIEIKVEPKPGQEIRKIGSDIEAHSVVIKKGIVLNAAELGVLAAVGKVNVKVYRRQKIGVISTGNELQDPSDPLKQGFIRDSNKITLLSILKQYGYEGQDFGLTKDEPNSVKHIFEDAFDKCDFVITTGGVSMGEYDVIKRVLETDFKAKIHFGRINMKPGKPTTFATCLYDGKIKTIFGLPGNPVSATVTCLLFVIPTLRHCENRNDTLFPKVEVKLEFTPTLDPERPEYHRVHLQYGGSDILAQSTGNQISSRLNSFVGADGLLILPPSKLVKPKPKNIEFKPSTEQSAQASSIPAGASSESSFGSSSFSTSKPNPKKTVFWRSQDPPPMPLFSIHKQLTNNTNDLGLNNVDDRKPKVEEQKHLNSEDENTEKNPNFSSIFSRQKYWCYLLVK